MKSLKCPHCNKNACDMGELFTLPYPLLISGWPCIKCGERIKLNWFFVKLGVVLIICVHILGSIIQSNGADPFGSSHLIATPLSSMLPFLFGVSLFKKI
ncbi:hypothetical protein [Desulfoluna limicola]|uniref:hypothetical protein n=1 Tax=Desulfoluna limicola TaxID=2810562 RepID=UPI001F2C1221|nr:hypothetical protein [Desulfoluna limicola]